MTLCFKVYEYDEKDSERFLLDFNKVDVISYNKRTLMMNKDILQYKWSYIVLLMKDRISLVISIIMFYVKEMIKLFITTTFNHLI